MGQLGNVRRAARLWRGRIGLRRHAVAGDLLCQLLLHDHLRNPYPVYDRIRDRGDVYHSRAGIYAITSHPLCASVLKDPSFMRRNEGDPDRMAPPEEPEVPGRAPTVAEARQDKSFLEMEVSDHMRWRRLVAPAFRPKELARYRIRAEEVAARLLDEALRRPGFDLIADYASPLPITIVCDLLGIGDVDVTRFAHYGRVTAGAIDGIRSVRQYHEFRAAMRELDELFADVVHRRRADPGDDLVSRLIAANDDGGASLSTREIVGTCQLLLTAGFETTTNLVGNAVQRLMADRTQWARLVADPELASAAAEESLRYDAPVQFSVRAAREEMEIAGERLPAGSVLMMLIGAANHDPSVFRNPHRFDIGRESASQHLSFVSGAHYCVGAPLARLESEVALRTLARRAPGLHITGQPRMRPTAALRGLRSLPVAARA